MLPINARARTTFASPSNLMLTAWFLVLCFVTGTPLLAGSCKNPIQTVTDNWKPTQIAMDSPSLRQTKQRPVAFAIQTRWFGYLLPAIEYFVDCVAIRIVYSVPCVRFRSLRSKECFCKIRWNPLRDLLHYVQFCSTQGYNLSICAVNFKIREGRVQNFRGRSKSLFWSENVPQGFTQSRCVSGLSMAWLICY